MSLISVLYSCAYGTKIKRAGYCVLPISNRLKCVGYKPKYETLNFPYHVEENKEKTFVFSIRLQKFYKMNLLQIIILETDINFSFLQEEDSLTNLYRIYVTCFT
jgi:hypothetical protein